LFLLAEFPPPDRNAARHFGLRGVSLFGGAEYVSDEDEDKHAISIFDYDYD
jgi:hypothetical protein